MLTNDQEVQAVKAFLSDDYLTNIYNCYGNDIKSYFKFVLEQLPHILKNLNISQYKSIRILKCNYEDIDDSLSLDSVMNYSHLTSYTKQHILIYIIKANELLVYTSDEQYDISNILKKTFVYEYSNCQDMFLTKDRPYVLPCFAGSESCFTISTFKSLEEALMQYKLSSARNATCAFIKNAIYDENRIFFKKKPEHFLRDSLNFYLNARLRGDNIEIRPEQIIDTTHPVDIKVSWGSTNHLALIEIKWLGQSINEETLDLATNYSAARANAGAKQLADYLEGNKKQVPNYNTIGYLVIYDLRRRNISKFCKAIKREDGFFYKDKEIEYTPNYATLRNDFHQPIRFFIEPRCEDAT